VLYVFGHEPLDVEACAASFRELFPDAAAAKVIVMTDGPYVHAVPALEAELRSIYPALVVADTKTESKDITGDVRFGRSFALPPGTTIDEYSVFFIGLFDWLFEKGKLFVDDARQARKAGP
jgi:diphthamide biosynthesis enzyme Dph1/Dph2-like protein